MTLDTGPSKRSTLPDLAALHRAVTPSVDEAMANARAVFALQPSLGELRAASANRMATRLSDDLRASLSTTWRGRLAWRLSLWYTRTKAHRG